MEWVILFLSVSSIILSFIFTVFIYKKIDHIKFIVISLSIAFSFYILVSGIFFWVDKFEFESVLITEDILLFILNIICFFKVKNKEFDIYWKKRSIILYIIIFVGFIVSFQKFEFFGMGQDEGVYQVKAIELAYGNTERQLDFKEYSNLETDEEKTIFENQVKKWQGMIYMTVIYLHLKKPIN